MRIDTRPPKVGHWTEQALRVLRERYLTRDGEEVRVCCRVAGAIARAVVRWGRSAVA